MWLFKSPVAPKAADGLPGGDTTAARDSPEAAEWSGTNLSKLLT